MNKYLSQREHLYINFCPTWGYESLCNWNPIHFFNQEIKGQVNFYFIGCIKGIAKVKYTFFIELREFTSLQLYYHMQVSYI